MAEKNNPQTARISPLKLLLHVVGMALLMFAVYEIYLISRYQKGYLTEMISWQQYPWVIMVIGVICMIPFHREIITLYKQVKQQQKEWEERNKPKF